MTYEQETQRFLINRIENGWAVLEEGSDQTFQVPESWLPEGAGAGDVLLLRSRHQKFDSGLHFFIDLQSREARQAEVEAMMKDLLQGEDDDAEVQTQARTRQD